MLTDEQVIGRLRHTLTAVAEVVPREPRCTWTEAKAVPRPPQMTRRARLADGVRRHRGWTLSIAIVVGAAGAGAGAAASGSFNSAANQSFRADRAIPLPASFGALPAFDPSKERLAVVGAGPEGTTISVWTYPESATILCVAAVESRRGLPTGPHQPGQVLAAGGCSGSPAAATAPSSPGASYRGLWRGASGRTYVLVAGSAPPGAAKVLVRLSDGAQLTAHVDHGWFAFGVPDGNPVGYAGTFYARNGSIVPGTISS